MHIFKDAKDQTPNIVYQKILKSLSNIFIVRDPKSSAFVDKYVYFWVSLQYQIIKWNTCANEVAGTDS